LPPQPLGAARRALCRGQKRRRSRVQGDRDTVAQRRRTQEDSATRPQAWQWKPAAHAVLCRVMARPGLSIDFDFVSDLAAGHLRCRMVGSRLSLLGCPSHHITIANPARGDRVEQTADSYITGPGHFLIGILLPMQRCLSTIPQSRSSRHVMAFWLWIGRIFP
jgi:hypothetical protein